MRGTRGDMKWIGLSLIAVCALCACKHKSTEPYYRDSYQEVTASVIALDIPNRLVSLRESGGPVETVYAGPEVRNLAQIKVGDQVVVSYHSAVAAALTTPDQVVTGVDQQVAAERSKIGEKPYAAVGSSVTTTVKIDGVDTSFNTVTFRRDDGFVRTVGIQDPEARKFIRKLKPGDLVSVTYAEAVAVSVRPAG
jgi:hypothetical protein